MHSVGSKDLSLPPPLRILMRRAHQIFSVTLKGELTDFLLESLNLRILTGDFLVLCCRPLLKDHLCPFLKDLVPCAQSCWGYLILFCKLVEGLILSQKLQNHLRFTLNVAE